MAIQTTTQLDAVQRYWQKKWSNLPVEEYETPLANSKYLQEATIPKGQGGSAYFRRINHFSPTTTLVNQSEELGGTDQQALTFETVEVPIKELVSQIAIGHMANDVDPVDLIDWSFKEFVTWVRRSQHLIVGKTMVNGFSDNPFGTTHTYDGFQTIFAGGAPSFGGLTPGSIATVSDFVDATDRIRNARAPKHGSDKYVCVIDESMLCDLMDQDSDLNSIVRQHRDLTKAVEQNKMISFPYKGLNWIPMTESWRTKLSAEGGGISTYDSSGKVHYSHIFGANAFGYVNHGSPALRKSPKFKVQDISVTGITTTIGFRIPMNVVILKDTWGINVAGTSNHDSVAVGG